MGLFDNISWQVGQKAASRLKVPSSIREKSTTISKALRGDISGVAGDVINRKFGLTPALGSFGSNIAPFGTAQQIIGGISIDEYRSVFEQANSTNYGKSNLWAISVVDLKPQENSDFNYVNFFATSVQYSALDGTGNAQKANSGFFDVPENQMPTEFQITTLDDVEGSIKRWFQERFDRCYRPDGTHGIPIEYLMLVEVQHCVVSGGSGGDKAYVSRRVCRVGRMDHNLDRRDDAMEEVNFTLVQHDSFIPA